MANVSQSEVDEAIEVLEAHLSRCASHSDESASFVVALAVLEGATIVADPEPDFTEFNVWAKEMALAVRTGVDRHYTRRAGNLAELKALWEAWVRSPPGEVEEMLAYRFTSDASPYVR